MSRVREGGEERERALQAELRAASTQLEELQVALRQAQWKLHDSQQEHQATVERSAYKCFCNVRQGFPMREESSAEERFATKGKLCSSRLCFGLPILSPKRSKNVFVIGLVGYIISLHIFGAGV